MSQEVLEIRGLSKRFGRIKAVDQIDLSIRKGSVFGILGPNGSGKSTTLGMVLGVVNPTAGSFTWFGESDSHEMRKRIGAILETPCFYPYLSAAQNLRVVAEIKGVDTSRIDTVLERVGLITRKNDKFQTYSLGMKQRLAIASALLADPEVMILDEPTNGLDPTGIADIRELIISLANEGRTIILASHLLDEVQRICTDFAVLRLGKKVYQGTVEELLRDKSRVQLGSVDSVRLETYLASSTLLTSYRREKSDYIALLKEGVDATALHREIIDHGITLNLLNQMNNSLEQKFLEILKAESNA